MTILCTVMLLSAGCTGKTTQPEATDEVNEKGQVVIKLGLFSSSDIGYGYLNWFMGTPASGLTYYKSVYNYLKDAAMLFSADNALYDVELIDYGSFGGDDYVDGLDRLNTDIMTGNMPDMLLLNGIPYENYARKGLFVDLYTMIDKEGLFPGLLSAMETDGRLFYISPENIAYTWFGLSSVIGSEEVTFIHMKKLLEQAKSDGADFFNDDDYDQSLTGEQLFNILYTGQRKKLINESEGTCDFTNQDFYEMLDLCKELGSIIKETEKFAFSESLTVDGELYFGALSVTVREYFQKHQAITSGRDINITGIPGSGELMCVMQMPLAVSAQASEQTQAGACEFIKAMLNRQYSQCPDYLTLSQTTFDKRLNKDFDYFESWEDGTEQPEEYMPAMVDGEKIEIKLPDFTKQDYDLMVGLINRATIPYYPNDPEYDIIKEEANDYFQGQYSVEKAAENIQAHMSIYMSEHY
jgi:ABC-type glycerol-3-phosphate transport system substrate-binding protein